MAGNRVTSHQISGYNSGHTIAFPLKTAPFLWYNYHSSGMGDTTRSLPVRLIPGGTLRDRSVQLTAILFAFGVDKMKISTMALIFLSLLLIGSNAWWFYHSIDFGVTHSHMLDSYQMHKEALNQVLSILPLVAQQKYTRDDVIQRARLSNHSVDSFEKDGFTWVGRIGIKFDKNGRVVEVRKDWE